MDNNKRNSSMVWMMVVCCALLLLVLFAGSAAFTGGYLRYVIFGALALAGVWMMVRSHGTHGEAHEKEVEGRGPATSKTRSSTEEKKDHSCCH